MLESAKTLAEERSCCAERAAPEGDGAQALQTGRDHVGILVVTGQIKRLAQQPMAALKIFQRDKDKTDIG